MNKCKWTVRNVNCEAIQKLHEVQQISGGLLGELVSEAIEDWFDHLPEETEDEESITPNRAAGTGIRQVRQDTLRLKTDAKSLSFESNTS